MLQRTVAKIPIDKRRTNRDVSPYVYGDFEFKKNDLVFFESLTAKILRESKTSRTQARLHFAELCSIESYQSIRCHLYRKFHVFLRD